MDLLHERFSPREYLSMEVPAADLAKIFETARWAQSCFNEQPWRFVVARKTDGAFRQELEGLLAEGNEFAKEPWVLGIAFGKKTFTLNQKPNRYHGFDTGAACQTLALAAFQLGWNTRFMGGFDAEGARAFATADYEPYAMFVIGKATSGAAKPPATADRKRRDPENYVYWGRKID